MFVSVKIQIDGSTVIPWTITTATDNMTLADLFDNVVEVGECVGDETLKVKATEAYIGTSRLKRC